MKRCAVSVLVLTLACLISGNVHAGGYLADTELWLRAVTHTEEKGPIDAIWQEGGKDSTAAGDRVFPRQPG